MNAYNTPTSIFLYCQHRLALNLYSNFCNQLDYFSDNMTWSKKLLRASSKLDTYSTPSNRINSRHKKKCQLDNYWQLISDVFLLFSERRTWPVEYNVAAQEHNEPIRGGAIAAAKPLVAATARAARPAVDNQSNEQWHPERVSC